MGSSTRDTLVEQDVIWDGSDVTDYRHTSERLAEEAQLQSASDYLLYLFHVATYEFARQYANGRRVLDYGCGTGYGTQRLADSVEHIVGVDIAEDAIAYAREHYLPPKPLALPLEYQQIHPVETAPLPFDDASFDTVLSFQVIEHVPSVENYLSDIRRVLKPGGTFVCATPDRRWRLLRGQRPFNRFHHDEWDPEGVASLLAPHFPETEFYGMTAPKPVMEIELRRVKRLRRAALPFTLPGTPERWRLAGIDQLKKIHGKRAASPDRPSRPHPFGLDDIVVAPNAQPSVNVISVSHRR